MQPQLDRDTILEGGGRATSLLAYALDSAGHEDAAEKLREAGPDVAEGAAAAADAASGPVVPGDVARDVISSASGILDAAGLGGVGSLLTSAAPLVADLILRVTRQRLTGDQVEGEPVYMPGSGGPAEG